ncbi:lysophospholipid acyltransferase family protein [Marinobacter sp. X15-166B]|uniref:lysophospholipid acyltransferase family protein n=1 Tax=Marinobacter sp. X15-166B TaxID=1897620 RepID=UPI00085BEB91|nr:1-acylglycerol-3-phosphate O-acyltransferase [Marinobacter sp. X15-166B]OEY65811.1 acyl-phosphate glycerol 3-phosphate acyltransferase [Marinobacter sp. X15-166B]
MALLRKALAWLSVLVICLFGLLICVARPFNPNNNRVLGRAIAVTGRWILGLQRPVTGLEYMPQDRPVVIIANHQHNDDLFLMGDLMPPRTVTVGKAILGWIPFFGQVFWLGGNVMLNRARSRKAVALMKATSHAITNENKSLWVFVEGTRSHGQGLGRFKKGAFHTAVAAQVPLVMICAESYRDDTEGRWGQRTPVRVRVLPAIETRGLTADDVPRLVADCHRQMAAAIEAMAAPQ